jgi:hypothetical protein
MTLADQTIRNIMDYHKNMFDNTFNAMMSMDERYGQRLRKLVDYAWLPDTSKKMILEVADIYHKGWQSFKKAADESYLTAIKQMERKKKSAA